jgi:hypothetical protein
MVFLEFQNQKLLSCIYSFFRAYFKHRLIKRYLGGNSSVSIVFGHSWRGCHFLPPKSNLRFGRFHRVIKAMNAVWYESLGDFVVLYVSLIRHRRNEILTQQQPLDR